jgi:hypothetical protein
MKFENERPGSVFNLTLFQKYLDFMDYVEPLVERFPKYERYALCTRIKYVLDTTMELIIETNSLQNKVAGWYKVDTKFNILRTYLRRSRARGSKYLSKGSYETAERKLSEAGRLLGGLIKKMGNQ